MSFARATALLLAVSLGACAGNPAPQATTGSAPSGPAALTFSTAPPHMPAQLTPAAVNAADDFLWLEQVNGARAQSWVKDQNARTDSVLKADARYGKLRSDALAILTAQDRIPQPSFRAGGIDNFWQDQTHVRGVWRHTTLASYGSASPQWETILDIDALSKAENANWIWKGADCLDPEETRCLVNLSDGGKDAVVVREFDTTTKTFVDGGFRIPEGKHRLAWLDRDTLLLATDFGAGSLTESGYPFIVKSLKRGQALAQASEVFRGAAGDGGYGVEPAVMRNGKGEVRAVIVSRPLDTFRQETWQIFEGKPVKLALPERLTIHGVMGGALVFSADQAWKAGPQAFAAGSLISEGLSGLRPRPTTGIVDVVVPELVFAPGPRQSVDEVAVFDDRVVATVYDNVRGRAFVFAPFFEGKWDKRPLSVPENSAVHLGSKSRSAGQLFYSYEGFLTPATLSLADVKASKASVVHQAPARFDASKHVVEQFEAVSRDGVRIPYFLVRPKTIKANATPTMMFGYGGFQLSYPPVYKPELGKLWLERGGAYVIANIRGGGEFGPDWHQAALNDKRQHAFDDFAAVAADLARRGVTSPQHLAIYGRSNGGVLTSVTLTQHPELIGAAVIESPLVDMLRYHELPPGASWMGEYGDPRIPAQAAWIASYSAYQNVRPGMRYPQPYITTNTRDDRVHPGHARKFAARLQQMGYPVLYYENTDGGHANDSDPVLNAERWARHYTYLSQRLMDDPPTGAAVSP